MKSRFDYWTLALMLACVSAQPRALTLNEIELSSYLNQTLDARIALGGVKSGDLDSLNLRVLAAAGTTEMSPEILKLEVMDDGNRHYIHITSRESIREPVFSFILELKWAEGHLIREYSVLMDPRK